MPVDTPNKRFSLMGMGRPWTLVLPVPDGTIEVSDRRQLIFRYPGLAAIVVVGNPRATLTARAHPGATWASDE